MKKIVLCLIASAGLTLGLIAQEATETVDVKKSEQESKRSQYTTAVMLVPQIVFENGIRLDVEFRAGNNAIVIGPTMYAGSGNTENSRNEYNEMIGAGLDLVYKVNLVDANRKFVPYGAFGLSYDYHSITANGTGYIVDGDSWRFEEDIYYNEPTYDTTFYSYFSGEKTLPVHKPGVDIMMGFQFSPFPRFVIDLSGGVAARFAFASRQGDFVEDIYGKEMYDIAYSGILPSLTLKIGMKL